MRPAPPGLRRDRRRRRLRLVGGRPDPGLRPRPHLRRGAAAPQVDRPAEPPREDPGDEARARRDRGHDRGRQEHQRDADLLAPALRRGRRGLPARARAARRRGRAPGAGRVGRELLRLARRHRDRPAARGDRLQGRARPARQARRREREARLPALPRGLLGPALGVPRRQGRPAAALPVGLDLDEEPRLPRRDVRRGPDRPGHGEHDAARDDRGVPGPRRGGRRR